MIVDFVSQDLGGLKAADYYGPDLGGLKAADYGPDLGGLKAADFFATRWHGFCSCHCRVSSIHATTS